MLECRQLQKSYGGQIVLDIPSLQLEKGIYWLQGPNGSGKTSFLRMVSGLLPFKGEITLDGISQSRAPVSYRRSVSWADAEPLYPAFVSGHDLIRFYCHVRKASSRQADELVKLFQAEYYLSAPVGTYSSGMTKKLSLILAFVGNLSLIALDEPFVTLDSQAIHALYHLIRESYQQNGISFLLSSHQDLEQQGEGQELIKLSIVDKTIQASA
jgi:ABC-2 type transport system ATP-binding protein